MDGGVPEWNQDDSFEGIAALTRYGLRRCFLGFYSFLSVFLLNPEEFCNFIPLGHQGQIVLGHGHEQEVEHLGAFPFQRLQ